MPAPSGGLTAGRDVTRILVVGVADRLSSALVVKERLGSNAVRPAGTHLKAGDGGSLGLYLLGGVTFGAWFLQFFTGLFEFWPVLGIGAGCVVAVLGAAVALQGIREPHPGWRAIGLTAGLAASVASLWALHTKLSYAGTRLDHPRYSAPHFAVPHAAGTRVVRLVCTDGVPVDGVYHPGRHAGAVVIYPGWVGGKDNFAVASLARWLAPGFQVLVLDPRGVGGSGGFQRGIGDGKLDIQAAAGFLRQNGATAVGVLAEGDVALAAALSAADANPVAEQRVDAVMLISPTQAWGDVGAGTRTWYDDPRTSFGRTYWRVAAGTRLARGQGPTLGEILPRVAPRPLLLVAHPGETAKLSQQLYLGAAEPRGLLILPGSGWPMDWGSYPAYYGAARDWFRRALASRTAVATTATASVTAVPATPEEKVMKEIMAEPQPLVPALPTPAGARPPAAPPVQVPALPAVPVPPPGIRR